MIKTQKYEIFSIIGLTWRTVYIIYKDNDTFLYKVKEKGYDTIYTFTDNYRNGMLFNNFEDAYSLVCIYNSSSWAVDNAADPEDKNHKLFVMPIEIKGYGKKIKKRMLKTEPLYKDITDYLSIP